MRKMKRVPRFETEEEERAFWQTHDSSEYLAWDDATEITLAKLKPSVKTISLRLPESMIEELKFLANKQDIPYQSLLKVFLAERLDEELESIRAH
jgi:predicted DNA binding CopG/RHH family protein